jgi:hypothetical protein
MSKIPSVTEVLRKYEDYSAVDSFRLEAAGQRGTEVHKKCLDHARGMFVLPPADEYLGYYNSFVEWRKRVVKSIHAVEPELKHGAFGFMGHPDLIVTIRGDEEKSLVDLKTALLKGRTWGAQLFAYLMLAQENGYGPIARVGILQLSKSGSMAKFTEYTKSTRDESAFLGALMAHKFFLGG